MRLTWKSFSICKDGNRADENEDALYPILNNGDILTIDQFSCAMSDGATQCSFSKLWANLLVTETSLAENMLQDFGKVMFQAQESWHGELAKKALPWPAEIKVRQGAHATLLWLTLWKQNGWMVHGIGDTCLFQFRKRQLILSYPLTRSDQFTNTPELVSTNLLQQRILTRRTPLTGNWEKGDQFIIATDALSQWLINANEKGEDGLAVIRDQISSQYCFRNWIFSLRKQAAIKNDDTTMIYLSIEE